MQNKPGTLTPAMQKALLQLPDGGGQEFWRLKGVSVSTLRALEKRGLAVICHRDGMGQHVFDRWIRTRKGHPREWMPA